MDAKEYVTSEIRCPVPWTGIMVNHDGQVKNCIRAYEDIGDLKTAPIRDIVLGSKNTEIQQAHQNNNKHTSCQGCHKLEEQKTDFNIVSDRKYYIKELRNVDRGIYDHNTHELHQIDVRWQNTCNFTCIYCGPEFSSKWAQELNVHQPKPNQDNYTDLRNYVFDNVKNLKNVYLAGGEPMLMTENEELLELLLKHNPDVSLRINTNLSHTDTRVFDLACKFKNVHWTVSAETMGDDYEYIRYGGQWATFCHNLRWIKDLGHKITFNMLYFSLNAFTVFYFIEKFKNDWNFHPNAFVIGPVLQPEALNVRHLPKLTLDRISVILQEKINEKPGYLLEDSYRNLLRYIQEPFEKNPNSTIDFLKAIDARRGTDSEKLFPYIYKLMRQ